VVQDDPVYESGPGYSVREAGLGLFCEREASPGDGNLPQGAVMYEKVGRLKPDSVNDLVRVIVDGQGDIGTITREDLAELLSGVEPQPVLPSGEADLSESTRGVKVTIPVDGQVYVVIAEQVRNMLVKWPRMKRRCLRWGNNQILLESKKRNKFFQRIYIGL